MSRGTLIAESIKPGSSLEGVHLTLIKIACDIASNASKVQPRIWTAIEFETTVRPELLAEKLSAVLGDSPVVWYCNFTEGDEVFVVYPKKIFRYRRGDALVRREAQEYGRSRGVPPSQLDWTE
jgi:hypothetical protein